MACILLLKNAQKYPSTWNLNFNGRVQKPVLRPHFGHGVLLERPSTSQLLNGGVWIYFQRLIRNGSKGSTQKNECPATILHNLPPPFYSSTIRWRDKGTFEKTLQVRHIHSVLNSNLCSKVVKSIYCEAVARLWLAGPERARGVGKKWHLTENMRVLKKLLPSLQRPSLPRGKSH